MQKQVINIIKELAKKHNIPDFIVEDMIKNQFRFIRELIRSGTNETILINDFGKFKISPRKLKWIEHHKAKKQTLTNDIHSTGELVQKEKD